MPQTIPVIDIAPLLAEAKNTTAVAEQLGQACRQHGFFYITGHGVDQGLQQQLETLSREFFAQPLETKLSIAMAQGGRAWRGYFPVGGELTSGQPDLKEGLYLGAELGDNHPLVRAGTPLHGRNLFPDTIPELQPTVLDYLAAMTALSHAVMRGIALSLGLEANYFDRRYTHDPLVLFRIFNYPAAEAPSDQWGVGEHTDYGLLTILKQDDLGGLQVKSQGRWIEAPPVVNSFVCNIGDMLDRITGGLYRSTPHRVKNTSGRDRLSFPFFFDPNFAARVEPIASLVGAQEDDWHERWDGASLRLFEGTYGDYVLGKVGKVFPELRQAVI
ncbi:isopenicillin N synthase family dioxygenase [Nodosilinea sp. PGN35]|uniref:isopenicillin N synthase family dioxygenase n=1 Tax=Nodosilinea sp. PGN35 TaxID=3020489 RepID=UPI0023B2E912|nr:2-oxoglutarate and iron-dependent oxygenase domain-containing protein [Nodosilinea sp. TSF1-S3]MDF0366317.1 2-oxoglutarate and iron-dependent oxygenase domain-containing protein [Nodosilinea sp. TSF1-S3]